MDNWDVQFHSPERLGTMENKNRQISVVSGAKGQSGSGKKKKYFSVKPEPQQRKPKGETLTRFKADQKERKMQMNRALTSKCGGKDLKYRHVAQRPSWFIVISDRQKSVLAHLHEDLHSDHCSGAAEATKAALKSLGMHPRPSDKLIEKAIQEMTAVKFLLFILRSFSEVAENTRMPASWNKNLLMCSICQLEFPFIMDQLNSMSSLMSLTYANDPFSWIRKIAERKLKFACLNFSEIEKHPELIRIMKKFMGENLSIKKKQQLWSAAMKTILLARYAYKQVPVPVFEGKYHWDSIDMLRKSAALKKEAFMEKFRTMRLLFGQELWMATLPSHFADDKILQLFSAYMVTDYNQYFFY